MTYTFDELEKKLEGALDSIGAPTEASDKIDDAVEILYKLREKYAPTVEMTDFAVNRLSEMVQTFGEYWGAGAEEYMDPETKGIEVEDTFVTFEQLKALMYPETIKVIDE